MKKLVLLTILAIFFCPMAHAQAKENSGLTPDKGFSVSKPVDADASAPPLESVSGTEPESPYKSYTGEKDRDKAEMLENLQFLKRLEKPPTDLQGEITADFLKFGPDLEKILPELIETCNAFSTEDQNNCVALIVCQCLEAIGEKSAVALVKALSLSQDDNVMAKLEANLRYLCELPIPILMRNLKTTDEPRFYESICRVLAGSPYSKPSVFALKRIMMQTADEKKFAAIHDAVEKIKNQPALSPKMRPK